MITTSVLDPTGAAIVDTERISTTYAFARPVAFRANPSALTNAVEVRVAGGVEEIFNRRQAGGDNF